LRRDIRNHRQRAHARRGREHPGRPIRTDLAARLLLSSASGFASRDIRPFRLLACPYFQGGRGAGCRSGAARLRGSISTPIVVNLDVTLARRKMRSKEFAEHTGITEQNVSLLKSGKVKCIRFETLDRICAVLSCQPGDILEYRAAEGED